MPTYYPHGYPTLIAAFDRAGFGVSWVLFGVNYVFAGIGLWAVYRIARGPYRLQGWIGTLVVVLTLLSYVFVKHIPQPMSDVPYFGLSTLSIYFLALATSFPDSRRWLPLAAGTALAALAIWCRTIGIALVPAVLWAAFSESSPLISPLKWIARRRLSAVILCLATLVGIVATALLVQRTQTKYLHELASYFDALNRGRWGEVLYDRVKLFGELFLNLPGSQLPSALGPLFALAGVIALIVVSYGFLLRRGHFGVVDVYLLSYLGIVMVWPASDFRFYLPILSMLMLWGLVAVRHVIASGNSRSWTVILAVYLIGFSFAGVAALAYSTSLTFAGDTFPGRYAKGTYESEYRIAFGGPYPEAASDHISGLEVLVRYEPRTNAYFRALPDYPRLSPELKEKLSHSAGRQ